jgi:hemoglobin-like flavoprotein
MVADMSYNTISNVLDSWERIRRMDNYEEVIGVKLFTRLFTSEPDAKVIFGFPKTLDCTDEGNMKSLRFRRHSKYFISMVDRALGMLGPDIEILTEILLELGEKHVAYGVKPEYFPSMGRALIDTMQEVMENDFTEELKADWNEVYGALSYDMIRGQKNAKK